MTRKCEVVLYSCYRLRAVVLAVAPLVVEHRVELQATGLHLRAGQGFQLCRILGIAFAMLELTGPGLELAHAEFHAPDIAK